MFVYYLTGCGFASCCSHLDCFLAKNILQASVSSEDLRKAIIGGSVKTSSKSLFILNISQCLLTAIFMSGRLRLYVSISGIIFDAAWFFWFIR